jgi:hypothetical protein
MNKIHKVFRSDASNGIAKAWELSFVVPLILALVITMDLVLPPLHFQKSIVIGKQILGEGKDKRYDLIFESEDQVRTDQVYGPQYGMIIKGDSVYLKTSMAMEEIKEMTIHRNGSAIALGRAVDVDYLPIMILFLLVPFGLRFVDIFAMNHWIALKIGIISIVAKICGLAMAIVLLTKVFK